MLVLLAFVGGVVSAYALNWESLGWHKKQTREAPAHVPAPPACPLCNGPIARAASSAQVIYELERNISDETSLVTRTLGNLQPEDLKRLYWAQPGAR